MKFIVRARRRVVAIEVKSARARDGHSGTAAFAADFRPARTLLVGAGRIGVEEFIEREVEYWIRA